MMTPVKSIWRTLFPSKTLRRSGGHNASAEEAIAKFAFADNPTRQRDVLL
jgi:hypothetical protein